MCIAIYKPAGTWASKEQLRNSFEANPHGAGYAYLDGTLMTIKKGFFTWRAFWKSYKSDITAEMQALIHFRIATMGEKNTENCHPFDLGNGVLMHNGPRLNYQHCAGDDKRSDSRQFAEDFIAGMDSSQVRRILPMIESFIGTEKVVMMFDNGEVLIAGEKQGYWRNGIWWSNTSFEGYGKRSSWAFPEKTFGSYVNSGYPRISPLDWLHDDEDDDTAVPSRTLPPKVVKPLWRCVKSEALGEYLPRVVSQGGETLHWNEGLCAYVDQTLTLSAQSDGMSVWDVVDSKGGEWDIVGEVMQDADHLRMFLDECDSFDAQEDDTESDEGTTALISVNSAVH